MIDIFLTYVNTICSNICKQYFSNISSTSFENSDVLRSTNVKHMLHETYVERMLQFFLLIYASLLVAKRKIFTSIVKTSRKKSQIVKF